MKKMEQCEKSLTDVFQEIKSVSLDSNGILMVLSEKLQKK